MGFSGTVAWFSQPTAEGGLGLPFPWLLAFLATSTEVLGLICITLGLFTRIIAIPMMIVMSVASLMVHWSHGWLAIASNSMESSQRMSAFLQWLMENFPGRYNYITQLGDPIILNNGIEFSATYFIMLLVLLIYGGGRYVSVDYWLKKRLSPGAISNAISLCSNSVHDETVYGYTTSKKAPVGAFIPDHHPFGFARWISVSTRAGESGSRGCGSGQPYSQRALVAQTFP